MKTELEVARDAVRTVYGDELADALEWAAAAVRHRATLLNAARAHAGICCEGLTHWPECRNARALHALDPDWSRAEVDDAHDLALAMARQRSDGPRLIPRPAFPPELEAELRSAQSAEETHDIIERYYRREVPHVDPARLTYSAGTAWPALPLRREALLSATLETEPPTTPHVWDGQWPVAHAASPSEVPTVSVTSGVDADASTTR